MAEDGDVLLRYIMQGMAEQHPELLPPHEVLACLAVMSEADFRQLERDCCGHTEEEFLQRVSAWIRTWRTRQ